MIEQHHQDQLPTHGKVRRLQALSRCQKIRKKVRLGWACSGLGVTLLMAINLFSNQTFAAFLGVAAIILIAIGLIILAWRIRLSVMASTSLLVLISLGNAAQDVKAISPEFPHVSSNQYHLKLAYWLSENGGTEEAINRHMEKANALLR